MLIAAAQFNPLAGDFTGNVERIVALARTAAAAKVRLLVTPQGALAGYPCAGWLSRPAFVEAAEVALDALRAATAALDLYLLVGHPVGDRPRSGACDAASLLHRGRIEGRYSRQIFSSQDPFDGARYFRPGSQDGVFTVDALRFGAVIGEDLQDPALVRRWLDAGVHALLALQATPFGLASPLSPAKTTSPGPDTVPLASPAALLVVEPVGAQDEFVFEGRSSARDPDGAVVARARSFDEDLLIVDLQPVADRTRGQDDQTGSQPEGRSQGRSQGRTGGSERREARDQASWRAFFDEAMPAGATQRAAAVKAAVDDAAVEARIYGALVCGVRDFVGKNGFPGVLLGLSGGIDSALVLAIAVDALGADRVHAVMMPSPYTADISREDARSMADGLGVRYEEIEFGDCFAAFRSALAAHLPDKGGTALENLQARIRGTLLMALSNQGGQLVLATGNKSESAVGYCTLYGDTVGGLAVIKDVYKTMVWRLAKWRNRRAMVIPQRIIERAPSAELAPGQLDEDSLPPYETLDAILVRHLEEGQDAKAIIAAGEITAAGDVAETVHRVIALVRRAEFKRHQSAPGIRVTQHPFDSEWSRFITGGFSG